ncbi:uncharacterized protein LOC130770015 isoform X3 [Actinidia eriantha]|uniref:uncharacterized protein LOC130770015 isoform X3 n=1 Tax=Actinidia eriantha TaxID=165200 RepID=UPI002590ABD2|nr:uncharacterized protein LOC130770015 isoform X3 [Actinidia eriantha]
MKCLICPCFCWHALNLSTANLFKRLFNTTLPGADTSMTEVTEMVPRLQWMEKQSFRLYLSKIPRSDSFVVCAPKGMKQCMEMLTVPLIVSGRRRELNFDNRVGERCMIGSPFIVAMQSGPNP